MSGVPKNWSWLPQAPSSLMARACPAVQGAGEVDTAGGVQEAEAGQAQTRLHSERGVALVRGQQSKLLGADTGEQPQATKTLK